MERKVWLFVFTLIIGGSSIYGKGVKTLSDGNSIAIGTSFFISQGIDLTFSGDLYISNSNLFHNSGRLFFNSANNSSINLPSGDLGTSEITFSGTKNYELTIAGKELKIGKLKMDLQGSAVSLNGNLVIGSKLELVSGILTVPDKSQLHVDNPEPEAVVFTNSALNNSWVSGFLSRKILADKNYQFPVGDAAGFHPFLISKPELPDIVRVAFDKGVPAECMSYNPSPRQMIENSFGWRVESDSKDQNSFFPGLSLLNTSLETKSAQLEVYHLADPDLTSSISSAIKNVQGSTNEAFYVLGSEKKSYGLYAFSQLFGVDLINFIYVGAGNQTTFEIPNQGDFSNVRLSVYNRLGSLMFKGDHYGNEFDARNYPDGTYFYELTLEQEAKKSFIRNFIEIRHEK